MAKTSHRAFAALDIGTSRIRLGGFVARSDLAFRIIADQCNKVRVGPGGAAVCSVGQILAAVDASLHALGTWCREQGVADLQLGLCGHVSSLLKWHDGLDRPVQDDFAIWMDATCQQSVKAIADHWGNGGAEAMLGTGMPAATNWLATKIHADIARNGPPRCRYLQIGDAVYRRLTGGCSSHPSTQVSLVDQRSLQYAPAALAYLALRPDHLPALDEQASAPLLDALVLRYRLPPTRVHAALQDTNAALFGMFPKEGDGLLLLGTSEIVGVYEACTRSVAPRRMVRTRLGGGWAIYGSSMSGGATVEWMMKSVLKRDGSASLAALTAAAEAVAAGADGVTCLPYLNGERAPLWDARWSGAFVGLRAHHGDAHLFRAMLEGIAMCRRQAAEALECPLPPAFRIAGGSSANALWNRIRASVFGRPLDVLTVGDLSIIGTLRHVLHVVGADEAPLHLLLTTERVEPERQWTERYAEAYVRFGAIQAALAPIMGVRGPDASVQHPS